MTTKYEGRTDQERLEKYQETLQELEGKGADNRVLGMWKSRVKKLQDQIEEAKENAEADIQEEDTKNGTTPEQELEPAVDYSTMEPALDEDETDSEEEEEQEEEDSPGPTPTSAPSPSKGKRGTGKGKGKGDKDFPWSPKDVRDGDGPVGSYKLTQQGMVAECPRCQTQQVPYPDHRGKVSHLATGMFSSVKINCASCGKMFMLVPDEDQEQKARERTESEGEQSDQEDSPVSGPKVKKERKPKEPKIGTPNCLCGCGYENREGSKFRMGHDAKLKSILLKVRRGDIAGSEIHPYTLQMFHEKPEIVVADFTAEEVKTLACKLVNAGQNT